MPRKVTILGANGKPLPATTRQVRALYDGARSTSENKRYYAYVDHLDARAANTEYVRRILRVRARYERDNNSLLAGVIQTLANDTVGVGPRLQMLTGSTALDRRLEREFNTWATAIALACKLRTMKQAKVVDGETFGLLAQNPRLPTEIKLDLKLVEADQIATPDLLATDRQAVDGIRFDAFGNPIEYHLLDDHPGSDSYGISSLSFSYQKIAARFIVHWFRIDRPGQARGVPEITSALYDFGELRRWEKAVLAAAETAADYAAILYSDAPPDGQDEDDSIAGETFDIDRRVMTTLPKGWRMEQFEAQQPVSTHEAYERCSVRRIVRCLGMPLNIALGDSSGYNYASGRLDHQTYFKGLAVEQGECERVVLDPLFDAWLDELTLRTDIGVGPARLEGWPHRWIWPGLEHVDPQKEAGAQETRLQNGMASFSEECLKQGVDPEDRAQAIADDIERFKRLGIDYNPFASTAPARPTPSPAPVPTGGGDADDQEEDDD